MNWHRMSLLWISLCTVVLGGCASVDMQQSIAQTNQTIPQFTQGELKVLSDEKAILGAVQTSNALLEKPLSQAVAVQVMLLNSPDLQLLMAQHWAAQSELVQSAQLPNPILSLERMRVGSEVEIGRLLSIGLFELLTTPWRYSAAKIAMVEQQSRLSLAVVEQVTSVRQAWVKAVTAQAQREYAEKVDTVANAGAELAKRMQQVGNFSALQRAKQQTFSLEAAAQLSLAKQAEQDAKEGLGRLLGLTQAQQKRLRLPANLPNLPANILAFKTVQQTSQVQRLDIKQAYARYERVLKQQGVKQVASLADVELGLRRDSIFPNHGEPSESKRGVELSVRLPLDGGMAKREQWDAERLIAMHQLATTMRQADSTLRQAYGQYQSAYALAKHYQTRVLPLKQQMLEENVLRYNGMLIGVFDLLSSAKELANVSMSALQAQAQFYMADANLQAAMIGRPLVFSSITSTPASSTSDAAH